MHCMQFPRHKASLQANQNNNGPSYAHTLMKQKMHITNVLVGVLVVDI